MRSSPLYSVLAAASLLAFAPPTAASQAVLTVPRLKAAVVDSTKMTKFEYVVGTDFDLVGAMNAADSKAFWESTAPGLVGDVSSIGVGSKRASAVTELFQVASGSWRFNATATLSSGEEVDSASSDSDSSAVSMDRLVAGGGNFAFGGIRPIVTASHRDHDRYALIAAPRAFANVSALSEQSETENFGAEFGLIMLYQRVGNNDRPVISLEFRAAQVWATEPMAQSLSLDKNDFYYATSTLTIEASERFRVAMTLLHGDVATQRKSLRFAFTILKAPGTDAAATTR